MPDQPPKPTCIMDGRVRLLAFKEAFMRQQFMERCGVTPENQHEYVEIVRPGSKPLVCGGRMELHHTPTEGKDA